MHTDQTKDLMYAFGDHDAYPAGVLELGFTIEEIDAAVDAGYLDHDGEIVRLTEDGAAYLTAAVSAANDAAYEEPEPDQNTAHELRVQLANARSMPVYAFGDVTLAEAMADRADAIADLQKQLARRESEEAGSWLGQHVY